MAEITLVEAVTQALAWEMNMDEDVVVFGEDVAVNGGVFRSTAGLLDRFGSAGLFRFRGLYGCFNRLLRLKIEGVK